MDYGDDMDFFETLNKQQQQAVFSTSPYVRIIAGAGSGKTRVLVLRLVHLIKNIGMAPHRLCAITFTNKAAREMTERLNDYLGDEASGVWLSTIHSLCVRILREDITALDYPKNFTICDSDDQKAILKEAYKQHDVDQKQYSYSYMLSYISNNKGAEVNPERALQMAGNYEADRLKANIYGYYEQRLQKMYALDFDDLLLFTARLFRVSSDVLKKWQARFDSICVDEFQDVDHIQYEIVRQLAGKNNELYVVGDPDQTIYTWRGADVNIILDFEKRFKPTETIVLNENYRSTTPILRGANAVIKNNKYRLDKELFTKRESEQLIYHMSLNSGEEEASWVGNKISELKDSGFNYEDMAILYRANYLSRNMEKKLYHHGIPHLLQSGIRFYDRKEVKDALSYLRMCLNQDDLSFIRTINQPKRGIGDVSIDKIRESAVANETTMYQAVVADPTLLGGKARAGLMEYIHIIEILQERMESEPLDKLVALMLDESGLRAEYEALKEQDRVENMKELINDAISFTQQFPDGTLQDYLEMVALYGDINEETGDAVRLMTIHSAKGLEFPVVFVIGLSEGIFPSERVLSEGKQGLEEERRLAYVAFTRAKDRLFLTENRGYSFVSNSNSRPSRFINEIDDEVIEHHQLGNYGEMIERPSKEVINDKLKGQTSRNNKFKKNEMIMHTTYGEGLILKIQDGIAQIAFNSPIGIKNVMLNHPAVSKIKKDKDKQYDA